MFLSVRPGSPGENCMQRFQNHESAVLVAWRSRLTLMVGRVLVVPLGRQQGMLGVLFFEYVYSQKFDGRAVH